MRLTAKERILLHLLDLSKYAEAVEVPPALTQEGVAQASWIDPRHLAQYVRPLVKEGLVRERTAHVKGIRQRRKVYDLADAGKLSAIRLREELKSEVVRVRDLEGMREASLSEVLAQAVGEASILDIVRQSELTGTIDLAALTSAPHALFVEMISGAPRLRKFVGRREELDAVMRTGDGPRVFVIRGVAGIGKSSFGAKACDVLRGTKNLFWHRVRPWDTLQSVLASLGEFLAALGKPGLRSVLTRGEVSRAAEVLREDLPGTQSFLVFDDAHEATPEVLSFFRLLKESTASAPDVRALVLTRKALSFYDRRDVVLDGLVREIDLSGFHGPEVAELFAGLSDPAPAVELGLKLGGHPLFLELLRAHAHSAPSWEALRDVQRFIEEEIYAKLSTKERGMMKMASLYRVPVPREALFPDPTLSHDILLSLTDRCLIRSVGEGRFEVHETIRDFFSAVLTSKERKHLGGFARVQLRELASDAVAAGDLVACIDCLSSALEFATTGPEREGLQEALGDANERMGDLLAASVAFKEAMKSTRNLKVLSRLHRKLAAAFQDRGDFTSAASEIDAGFRALGERSGPERGHLELARSRILVALGDVPEGLVHGEASLRAFEQVGDEMGQARACLELASLMKWTKIQDQADREERYIHAAMDHVDPAADPVLASNVRQGFAGYLVFRKGDLERAKGHLAAVEAIPGALDNPLERMRFLRQRGFLRLYFEGDFSGAQADYIEALRLARQLRDIGGVSEAKYHLTVFAIMEGRPGEARRLVQDAADQRMQFGMPPENELGWAGEYSLMEGNLEEFTRILAALNDPKLIKGQDRHPYAEFLRAFDQLIQGDHHGSLETFGRLMQEFEALRRESFPYLLFATRVRLYLGAALHAIGREQEAEEYVRGALDIFRAFHQQGALTFAQQRVQLLKEGLRRLVRT